MAHLTSKEMASCFSGPNALLDVGSLFGSTSAAMTPLQLACFYEDRVKLSTIIENRNTHFSTSPGSIFPPPLHLCCMWKMKRRDVDTDVADPCSGVSYGSVECAEMLLLHGADVNGLLDPVLERLRIGTIASRSATLDDPLEQSHRGSVVALADSDHRKFASPLRPLHLALLNNNTALVKLLLLHGAAILPLEKICLWCCATSWSIGGLAMLASLEEEAVVKAASDPRGLDEEERTAMHIAVLNDPREEYCIANSDVCEHAERLVHFLDMAAFYGCAVNAQDIHGNTALHYAWRYGHAHAAVHLVEHLGADPMIQNKAGMTPFQFHSSSLPSAAVLLAGLASNLHLSWSWKELYEAVTAVLRHDPAAVVVAAPLHDASSKATRETVTATTALHVLCESYPSLKELYPVDEIAWLAEEMLRHSPHAANALDGNGCTPLFVACSGPCSADFIDVLLAHGADPRSIGHISTSTGSSGGMTCLQRLLQFSEPYYGIGDVALTLVAALGNFDINDLSESPTSSRPLIDAPVVQTHPYWQSFLETVCPPKTEKEKRAREADRFYRYASMGLAHPVTQAARIVGELSSVSGERSRRQEFLDRIAARVAVVSKVEGTTSPPIPRSYALPPACEAAIGAFRVSDLNGVKFNPTRHRHSGAAVDDDGSGADGGNSSVQAGLASLTQGLPSGHVLAILLHEREEEQELRRQCLESPFVIEEMRRQHLRTLHFAATRHAHMPGLADHHHCRLSDPQARLLHVQ